MTVTETLEAPEETPLQRVGQNELGRISVSAKAVEKVAAFAALEIPDAGGAAARLLTFPGAGRRRGGLDRLPKVNAEVDGGQAFLEVELSVRWPAPIAKVTDAVRRRLAAQVLALTGLEVTEVNIVVVDLVTEVQTARVT